MIERQSFLEKFRISNAILENCGVTWDELTKIVNDYEGYRPTLEPTAISISDCLRQASAVHSLKIRLKDPEHLMEKIIRKKTGNPGFDIGIANYKSRITDLIGIKALHLFKEDWVQIHEFILSKWDLCENPVANIRSGDQADEFKKRECEINEHIHGYRSIHYLIKSQPTKDLHIAEIQVRTIFEEGWSEIDHEIRYPYDMNNEILNLYLINFNRLAGAADEMGTCIRILKKKIDEDYHKHRAALEEKDKMINDFREKIGKLNIEKSEREKLENQFVELSNVKIGPVLPYSIYLNSIKPYDFLQPLYSSNFISPKSNPFLFCAKCGSQFIGSDPHSLTTTICPQCKSQNSDVVIVSEI